MAAARTMLQELVETDERLERTAMNSRVRPISSGSCYLTVVQSELGAHTLQHFPPTKSSS